MAAPQWPGARGARPGVLSIPFAWERPREQLLCKMSRERRSIAGALRERRTSVVGAVEQARQWCEARIGLIGLVLVHAACQGSPAHRAQPGAIRPAERMHRLGQAQLIVQEWREVDFVVVVDALRLVSRVDLNEMAAVRIERRQELLVDRDSNVLHVWLEAAGTHPPQGCCDGSSCQDASIGP